MYFNQLQEIQKHLFLFSIHIICISQSQQGGRIFKLVLVAESCFTEQGAGGDPLTENESQVATKFEH